MTINPSSFDSAGSADGIDVPVLVGVGVSVGMGVEVDVNVGWGLFVLVVVGRVISVDVKPGWVAFSALAGLTLYCRIGQKIKIVITSRIEEKVSTNPRDKFARMPGKSSSSKIDLHSWPEGMRYQPRCRKVKCQVTSN